MKNEIQRRRTHESVPIHQPMCKSVSVGDDVCSHCTLLCVPSPPPSGSGRECICATRWVVGITHFCCGTSVVRPFHCFAEIVCLFVCCCSVHRPFSPLLIWILNRFSFLLQVVSYVWFHSSDNRPLTKSPKICQIYGILSKQTITNQDPSGFALRWFCFLQFSSIELGPFQFFEVFPWIAFEALCAEKKLIKISNNS